MYHLSFSNTHTWLVSRSPFSGPKYQFLIPFTGGLLYVIGGLGRNGYITRCERWNPSADCWSPIARVQHGKSHAHIATVHDKIYYMSELEGRHGRHHENEVYDIATDTWRTFPSKDVNISSATSRHYFATLKDKLYILSDSINGACLHVVQCFDPVTNQWSARCPENDVVIKGDEGDYDHELAPSQGKPEECIFVINNTHRFYYNIKNNRWGNLPVPQNYGMELDMEGKY